MRLVIIGAGNVATILGRLFKNNGHQIIQVISSNGHSAKILAAMLNCDYADKTAKINLSADFYLMAISDKELTTASLNFQLGNKLVVHTAGAVSKEVLKDISTNYGVMYPLQSLRKDNSSIPINIPLLIDANTIANVDSLQKIAQSISHNVSVADDELRLKLHVAAVFVNNFTNYLYEVAAMYCDKEGADFKLLLPLIKETANRLNLYPPSAMRTGPAVRGDMETIQKHLQLLQNYPQMKALYINMSEQIMGAPLKGI